MSREPPAHPRNSRLARGRLSVRVRPSGDGAVVRASGGVAAWVVLTTTAAGRFEENGFFLRPGEERAVNFVPLDPDGAPAEPLTAASVRVEHLDEHLLPSRETSGRRRDRLRARAAALCTTCLGAGGEGRDGL